MHIHYDWCGCRVPGPSQFKRRVQRAEKAVHARIGTLEKHDGRTQKKLAKQFREDYELLIAIEENREPRESPILTQVLTQDKERSPHHALQATDSGSHRKCDGG